MLVKHDFYYPPADAMRTLHIYLPEGAQESGKTYPVMYFFDGHNLFSDSDATYGKSWGLLEFLEQWDKPMIVVGIECSHEGNARLSEYLPYKARRGWFAEFEPKGNATMKWIVEDVKPYIDKTYPTMPFRECTGIGGSSMGGLMAVFAVAKYNRWFSKGACISSAAGLCMPQLRALLRRGVDPDTRAYLSWGTREAAGVTDHSREDTTSYTARRNHELAGLFRLNGASARVRCQVGGSHCEADWERLVPEFMEYLWKES